MGTMSLVVAVSMESELIAEFLSSSFAFWSDVVNFNLISLAERQFTPCALALLLVEQHG